MADNEGMSLKEFIELELKAVSLDWPRIAE
jgi:hypothetical protein